MTSTPNTFAVVTFLGALGFSTSLRAQPIERPDWGAHFLTDGTAIRAAGVIDAVFLEDKISDGVGVDMSVAVGGAQSLLNNGVVPGPDDLGNAYLLAQTDSLGDLIYYVGVQRLTSVADTWIEFELNRGIVRVRSGAPWPIEGERTAGDLVVRLTYQAGVLARAELFIWDGSGFRANVDAASLGPGCTEVPPVLLFCDGPPPLRGPQPQVWDAQWRPVLATPPNGFAEIGLNVTALLGSNAPFTTMQVRTPRDIILDSFRMTGSKRRRLVGEASHD